jgi:hypothetical protein
MAGIVASFKALDLDETIRMYPERPERCQGPAELEAEIRQLGFKPRLGSYLGILQHQLTKL